MTPLKLNPFQSLMVQLEYTLCAYFHININVSKSSRECDIPAAVARAMATVRRKQPYLRVCIREGELHPTPSATATIPLDVRPLLGPITRDLAYELTSARSLEGLKIDEAPVAVTLFVDDDPDHDLDSFLLVVSIDHSIGDARSAFLVGTQILNAMNSDRPEAGAGTDADEADEGELVDWFGRLESLDSGSPESFSLSLCDATSSSGTLREPNPDLISKLKTLRSDRSLGRISGESPNFSPYRHVERQLSPDGTARLRAQCRAAEHNVTMWAAVQAATSIAEAELIVERERGTRPAPPSVHVWLQVGQIVDTRRLLHPPLPDVYVATPGSTVLAEEICVPVTVPVTGSSDDSSSSSTATADVDPWAVALQLHRSVTAVPEEPLQRLKSMALSLGSSTGVNNYGNVDAMVDVEAEAGRFSLLDAMLIVNDRVMTSTKAKTLAIMYTVSGRLCIMFPFSDCHFLRETIESFADRVLQYLLVMAG